MRSTLPAPGAIPLWQAQQNKMTTETKIEAPKKLTITLTDRPPVRITEDEWPIIASAQWSDHDGQVECQANRRWSGWLKVRQHDDGRTIAYGRYSYSTQWQGEHGSDHRAGHMVTPSTGEYPIASHGSYWTGQDVVLAIQEVGARLAARSSHDCWTDLIAECIADLPADELT